MTQTEIAEDKERDASRQRRRDEREAAALAAADLQLEARDQARTERGDIVEAAWVADTQLQLSQLSYLDADADAADDEVEAPAELGSQAQPVEISSSDGDDEPRRPGRVKRSTRVLESQQWQVEHRLIPAPGSKAKARALNKKRSQNTKTSQLDHQYELIG